MEAGGREREVRRVYVAQLTRAISDNEKGSLDGIAIRLSVF